MSNLQYPLCKMYAESNVTSSYAHVIKRFDPYNLRCMSRAQLEAWRIPPKDTSIARCLDAFARKSTHLDNDRKPRPQILRLNEAFSLVKFEIPSVWLSAHMTTGPYSSSTLSSFYYILLVILDKIFYEVLSIQWVLCYQLFEVQVIVCTLVVTMWFTQILMMHLTLSSTNS